MNKLLIPALMITCGISDALANNNHKFSLGVNYHLEQAQAPGFQVAYQWQFSESFEVDTRLMSSNDIEVNQHSRNIFGEYQQFSIGANFIKSYNQELAIKAGTGLAISFSSSNDQLISNSNLAPYLLLALNYQLSNRISLEFGQLTQFNDGALDTNHSIYLNVGVQFGAAKTATPIFQGNNSNAVKTRQTKVPQQSEIRTTEVKPKSQLADNKPAARQQFQGTNFWYVQFGAFVQLINAERLLAQLQQLAPELTLSIINDNNYYRIVSDSFVTKQRAEDYTSMIKFRYALSGYVTQFKK